MRGKGLVWVALLILIGLTPVLEGARFAVQSVLDKNQVFPVEGLPANSVLLNPRDVGVDGAGNLYIVTLTPNQVLRVGGDGVIHVVAGGGTVAPADGVRALDVRFSNAQHIAVEPAGVFYLSDLSANRIFRVGLDGVLTIYAGNGQKSFSGDGGPATAAALNSPRDIALDSAGNLYVADLSNYRIRKITKADGMIQTIAGNGSSTSTGDGGPATAAGMTPSFVGADNAGNVYFAEFRDKIRKVAADGTVTKISGGGNSHAENVPTLTAAFDTIVGFAVAADGTLYASVLPNTSSPNMRVRAVSPSGNVTTLAGGTGVGSTGDGGPAAQARLASPGNIAASGGSVWFVDFHVIRKVSGGNIQRVAGTHDPAAAGEGGPVANSKLRSLTSVTTDAQGNHYFSDIYTHSVYKAPPDLSNLTLLIGTGYPGYNGEAGTGRQFALNRPIDVEVDAAGNVYVSDVWNYRIVKMTPGGAVTTLAGAPADIYGDVYTDGMPARRFLIEPTGLRADGQGNLYFVEVNGSAYRISPGGTLNRVFFSETMFSYDRAVELDAAGNIYVADGRSHVLRKVAPGGAATIIAGADGQAGFTGDGGPAAGATLRTPKDVRVDAAGNIYVLDAGNNRVRRIAPGGVIDTIAGGGTGFQNQAEATGVSTVTSNDTNTASLHLEPGGRLWLNDNNRLLRMEPARLFSNWVYNCASFVNGPVAPGECFAFYGEEIGPGSLVSATYGGDGNLARNVSDTQVLVNGSPVPLIFVSGNFNAGIMPYGISGTVKLEVQRGSEKTNSIDLAVAPTMPGLFTYAGGTGQIVAVNAEDWTFNGSAAPATRGQWMTVFLTGQGAVNPPVGDGVLITGPTFPAPSTPLQITVGGVAVPPGDIWAGLTYQGVLQVNFKVPVGAPAGTAAVVVTMGEASSQAAATVNLR